jgi:hypothetical protein
LLHRFERLDLGSALSGEEVATAITRCATSHRSLA